MDATVLRSMTVVMLGLVALGGALMLLDVELTREAIAWFVLLPLSGILVALGLGFLVRAFIADR